MVFGANCVERAKQYRTALRGKDPSSSQIRFAIWMPLVTLSNQYFTSLHFHRERLNTESYPHLIDMFCSELPSRAMMSHYYNLYREKIIWKRKKSHFGKQELGLLSCCAQSRIKDRQQ